MNAGLFAVYVSGQKWAQDNLLIGERSCEWGWKDGALASGGAEKVLRSVRVGDWFAFGTGGPNTRVPVGGWAAAALVRVVVAQVDQILHRQTNRLWPDEVYPNRVRFNEMQRVRGDLLPVRTPVFLEPLRMSANKRGVAIVVDDDSEVRRILGPFTP